MLNQFNKSGAGVEFMVLFKLKGWEILFMRVCLRVFVYACLPNTMNAGVVSACVPDQNPRIFLIRHQSVRAGTKENT